MFPALTRRLSLGLLLALLAPSEFAFAQTTPELREKLGVLYKAKDWPAAETLAHQITTLSEAEISDWRNLVRVLS